MRQQTNSKRQAPADQDKDIGSLFDSLLQIHFHFRSVGFNIALNLGWMRGQLTQGEPDGTGHGELLFHPRTDILTQSIAKGLILLQLALEPTLRRRSSHPVAKIFPDPAGPGPGSEFALQPSEVSEQPDSFAPPLLDKSHRIHIASLRRVLTRGYRSQGVGGGLSLGADFPFRHVHFS